MTSVASLLRRLAFLFALLLTGCYSDGFLCGTALESDSSIIRRCNGVNQICVCAANSCASKDSACPSGFRYGPVPFIASHKLKNECVSAADLMGQVIDAKTVALCGESADMAVEMSVSSDLATTFEDAL